MNDKVRVALVIVEDDIDLRVHPVVYTGVKKITRGVTGVDGWRSSHGGISYSKPAETQEEESVNSASGTLSGHQTFETGGKYAAQRNIF